MEADYDPDSGYHTGSIAVQEAKAHLGMFKYIEEVPARYRLSNFASELDPGEVWSAFVDDVGDGWSESTLEYRYKSPWDKWCTFCEERSVHPLTPTAEDVEAWFCEVKEESASLDTLHDIQFRMLFLVFDWLVEHTEYAHRYNPVLQSALLNGVGEELWEVRVMRRKKYADRWEADTNE